MAEEENIFSTDNDPLFGDQDDTSGITDDTHDDGSEGLTDNESLIDPATLPEELRPHWARMTRAHQQVKQHEREMQAQLEEYAESHRVVQDFNADPRGNLFRIAQQLGINLQEGSAPQQGQRQPVNQETLQAVRESLSDTPELMAFAEPLARAVESLVGKSVAPLQQQQQQAAQQQRQQMINDEIAKFETRVPQWRQYENEMAQRANFVRAALNGDGPMSHAKYGSVMDMLYGWVTGNSRATAEAGRRMAHALDNASPANGNSGRTSEPDVASMIKNAKNTQDKFKIAFQAALHEHGLR